MKILQVGKFYFPNAGGIETVVQNLSEGLVALGDQVTVLCSSYKTSSSIESINGVTVVRAPYFGKLFSQPLTPTLPFSIMRLVKQFDLVHFHSPNPLAETSALAIARAVPLVATYHADIVRQRALKPFYKPVLRAFLKRQRRVFVATHSHIENSEFIGDLGEKCSVIPFGISPSKLAPTARSRTLAAELRNRHGRFILFVGRLVEYKGLAHAIEAMAKLATTHPDWKLVIVGDGPLNQALRSQASQLGIQAKVHFEGHVESNEDLNAYYEACEIFLLPSITKAEAFGMVLLEAMSFAKPLVTTQLSSGVREVNQDGVSGIQVPVADAPALGAALAKLCASESLRARLGQGALARYNSNYTADAMVRAYREEYLEILSPK